MNRSIDQLLYPIADALQMDFTMKKWRLYGEAEVDLDLIAGIPIKAKTAIVSSVVDEQYSTVGVILKVIGNLYIAMINDDRVKQLTFLVVDGVKAGFNDKFDKDGRLPMLDKLGQNWSRKKFYSIIAPGVRATFTRPSVANDWVTESTGPEAALEYVAMRNKQDSKKQKSSYTAEELNAENAKARQDALTGKKH